MEFCDGGDLKGRIEHYQKSGEKLQTGRSLIWITQIAMALKYCHERNILHRDLKPENIFVMKDNLTAKLGDFGVARKLSFACQLASTVCGTPLNFSPELIEGKPYAKPTDIWALGCVIYELTFLEHPFLGPNETGNLFQLGQKVFFANFE